jgi:hypothetical protein
MLWRDGLLNWLVAQLNFEQQLGNQLPNAPEESEIPEVGELDELKTFVGSKKQSLGVDSGELLAWWDSRLGGGT